MKKLIELATVKCERCGHAWVPRVSDIRTCAKCRSPYWNKPKK